ELVAGVRFKAWQPPSGLHPSLPAHNPLVFDLLDTWNQRSLGGCTYYVAHPGGRSYDSFPVNANEAESRRVARFRAMGHSPGRIEAPAEEPSGDLPFTLDLRWSGPC
ncbi:MAG: transglutaminase family protein, partial [Chromatiaceae bacterium]|nr:transglutaminase family protein [Chromatiaceae bacterium]